MNSNKDKNSLAASLGRLLVGGVVGAVFATAFIALIGADTLKHGGPGILISMIAGLVYLTMGIGVGAGVLVPGMGARFLNVQDGDELREDRPKLGLSAIACLLIGTFLLVLSLAPLPEREGSWSIELVAAIAGVCLAGALILTIRSRAMYDELTRHISLEASALALHAAMLVLGGWAVLAHLGYVRWMNPLTLVGGFALLQLLAIFWVSGRRGLLKQR